MYFPYLRGRHNKIKTAEKKNMFRVMCNMIFTFILNIACGIIASILYARL